MSFCRGNKRVVATASSLAVTSFFLALVIGVLASRAEPAATCNVPGSHASIQNAVNDLSCDTINLTNANYYAKVTIARRVTIQGKGMSATTLDGAGSGRIFTILPGSVVTLTDITITNGSAHDGGGIHIISSTVTIDSVAVISNTANNMSGGIHNDMGGILRISNSTIRGNSEPTYAGGIFNHSRGVVELFKSSVSENSATGYGGGILNYGTLTLTNSILMGNSAEFGAGVYNEHGRVAVTKSNISGNQAKVSGGIYSSDGSVQVTDSLINGNAGGAIANLSGQLQVSGSAINKNTIYVSYVEGGAGILNNGAGVVTITNSTLSGNRVVEHQPVGGAINNYGTVYLANSTISGNLASRGGGIWTNRTENISMQNTILAGNSASNAGSDCYPGITSAGYSIVGSTISCTVSSSTGDLLDVYPGMYPLLGNDYHALIPGSPAIDAGDPAGCKDYEGALLTTDQRGIQRPIDGDGDSQAICDIGAVEYHPDDRFYQTFLPVTYHRYCSDYFDDFSDPTSGWYVGESENVRSEYFSGEFRILSKKSGYFYLYRAPACGGVNYVVEVDARWVGQPGNHIGLLIGLNADFSRFYLFTVDTTSQEWRIWVADPSTGIGRLSFDHSQAIHVGNGQNHLKVSLSNSHADFEINGDVVYRGWSLHNLDPDGTRVGLVSNPFPNKPNSDARFDDFRVTTNGVRATTLSQMTDDLGVTAVTSDSVFGIPFFDESLTD